jgi:hypothetical protein
MTKKPPSEIDGHSLKTTSNIKTQSEGRSNDKHVESLFCQYGRE